jgi:hypothetical protein
MLAKFARDELQKERLSELCSAEGQADLYAYNHRERRTYIEVALNLSLRAEVVPFVIASTAAGVVGLPLCDVPSGLSGRTHSSPAATTVLHIILPSRQCLTLFNWVALAQQVLISGTSRPYSYHTGCSRIPHALQTSETRYLFSVLEI